MQSVTKQLDTEQKIKFSTRKVRIWPHLLNKSLMENFVFCAVCNNGVYLVSYRFHSKPKK